MDADAERHDQPPTAPAWRRGDGGLGLRLRLALVAVALSLAVLGGVGVWAMGALRANVDRWAVINALDASSEALTAAATLAAEDGLTAHRAAVAQAFAAVEAAKSRITDSGDASGADVDQAIGLPLARAREAYDAAAASEQAFREPRDALSRSQKRLAALIDREFSASWATTRQSRKSSMLLETRQRALAARQTALIGALSAALRLQEAVHLYARTYATAGMLAPVDLSALPDCDGGDCGPSTARVRAAVSKLKAELQPALTGAAMAAAMRDALWAIDGYVRALRGALTEVTERAAAKVDGVAAERAQAEREEARRRSLQRLIRAASDVNDAAQALAAASTVAALQPIEARLLSLLVQFDIRGAVVMSTGGAQDLASAYRSLRRELRVDWARALAAKRRQIEGMAGTRAALAELDAAIKAKTAATLSQTRNWIAVFASYAAGFLFLVGVASAALLVAAERGVARPLADVTEEVMRLASGSIDRAVRPRAGAFAPLFGALETLRHASKERLRLERAQAKAALRLQKERDDAARLETALRQEQGKIEFWRRVISMVNHELRTPLSVIDGQARKIDQALRRHDPEELGPRAQMIRRSVHRMTELMETFLLNARADAGRLDFSPAPFDVGALIVEVCEMQQAATPGHRIEVDAADAPPRFDGDARLLRHALANLLSNAVKYSPRADSVSVRCHVGDGVVRIAVSDRGVGVPPDEIARLGAQFFRASTSGSVIGTGVGLHLARTIAEAHEGRLEIASEVGAGSTFALALPLRRAARGEADGSSAAAFAADGAADRPAAGAGRAEAS